MGHQSLLACLIATGSVLSLIVQSNALTLVAKSDPVASSTLTAQAPITEQKAAATPAVPAAGVAAQANVAPTAQMAATGPAQTAAAAAQAAAAAAQTAAAAAASAAKSAADAAALPSAAAQSATVAQSPLHAVSPVVQHIANVVPNAQAQATTAAQPNPAGVQVASEVPLLISGKDSDHLPEQFTAPAASWSSSQWTILRVSSMIAGVTFAMLIKALCFAGNVMVCLSPYPQAMRWKGRKCTGEADAAPYVSIAFGGCQWCFYGLFAWYVTSKTGFMILVYSNCLGAVLGTYYTMTFYKNCRNEASLDSLQKYLSAVTALVCLQVCGISILPAERALFLTGLVSSFTSFVGACSVLVTIPQVLRLQDSRSIPGPLACASVCSAILWSVCGWLLEDPMVLIPSMFSLGCSTSALACKAMYPSMELTEKQSLNVLYSVEEGVSLMRRSIVGKASKAGLPPLASECIPLKSALFGNKQEKFAATSNYSGKDVQMTLHSIVSFDDSYDGTGGTC